MFKRTVAKVLATAALAGGLLALAAPANAATTTESPSAAAGQVAVSVAAETVQVHGSSVITPQWRRVYRGSFRDLWVCNVTGQSWVSSGAALAYNCGLDNRFPNLPWGLYTFHN